MPDTIQWTLNFCAGVCVALLFEVVRIQIKVDDIEKRLCSHRIRLRDAAEKPADDGEK